jgi:hypothetical protein
MNALYLSSDQLSRRVARRWATRDIYEHPREVDGLDPGDLLVIDFDHIGFDAKDEAVALMLRAVRRGVRVGVHTYNDDDARLDRVRAQPGVIIRKRQEDVLIAIKRQADEQRRAA